MAKNKVLAYIGLCFKANKIIVGSSAISVFKGKIYLLILDGKAKENSKKYAIKFKNKFNCPLVICNDNFEEVCKKPLCRVVAISDKNLADAILNSGDVGYQLYTEGGE